MKIIQVLTTLSYGDAVGNDCLAILAFLKEEGYKTEIYVENLDSRISRREVKRFEEIKPIASDDVILYHLSTGTKLNEWIKTQKCRKVMIYHNITPPDFFENYNRSAAELCHRGLKQVEDLKDSFDYVLVDSEFNKEDLRKMGYQCPIDVLPILIPFEDYDKKPNLLTMKEMDDGYTNIIFVGRIAPNKKQEDLIKTFFLYKKRYNENSRLILVGSYGGMESYYGRLQEYVKRLNVKDVEFTGHIKFDKILAYYRSADLFLCMSEHEGFCVPLVEAMHFGIPIVAYDSCAIKGTLGGSGFLLTEKNYDEMAGVMNRVLTDNGLRIKILENQKERLADFSNVAVKKDLKDYLEGFLNQRS